MVTLVMEGLVLVSRFRTLINEWMMGGVRWCMDYDVVRLVNIV